MGFGNPERSMDHDKNQPRIGFRETGLPGLSTNMPKRWFLFQIFFVHTNFFGGKIRGFIFDHIFCLKRWVWFNHLQVVDPGWWPCRSGVDSPGTGCNDRDLIRGV